MRYAYYSTSIPPQIFPLFHSGLLLLLIPTKPFSALNFTTLLVLTLPCDINLASYHTTKNKKSSYVITQLNLMVLANKPHPHESTSLEEINYVTKWCLLTLQMLIDVK